ncbi:MAG: hypothetical protein JXJ04_25985 [Spirochaetales bacterium]|nr:hypothetical protein [Spirochaetales bacterium]
MGLGGTITALNTFIEIGPQRASEVCIVSLLHNVLFMQWPWQKRLR